MISLRICLLALTGVVVIACGGGSSASPVGGAGVSPVGGASATPAGPVASGGQLPSSGALVRVVNLFADDTGGHELDVFGFGGTEIVSDKVLVGSVGYGSVTDWFDPGFITRPSGGRTISIAVHRKGDPKQLAGISDTSVDSGARWTVIVQPPDTFGVGLRGAFDRHPDTSRADVPQALPDSALLVTSHEGVAAPDLEDAIFYASVGDFCLPGKFADPAIEEILGHPAPQPVGNELVVKPGSYTLTIHRAPTNPGEIATCKDEPIEQVPLAIKSGERVYAFLYVPPGESEVKVLLVPLGG